jgi:purine-nucleoside phosphorylase
MDSNKKILKTIKNHPPKIALILGSGWNKFIEKVKIISSWNYQDLFQVKSTVPGHTGNLIYGLLAQKPILILNGRYHIYEGHSAQKSTEPICFLKNIGVETLITTAACGALNPKYKVGDFVILKDMLTLFCQSPLNGPDFQDLSQAYDKKLQRLAINCAKLLKLPFQNGIYVYTRGPHFETPADKKALWKLGADVVGMSTVPEVIQARALNIKVLSLAFVTNLAFVKHDHQDVLAQADKSSKHMSQLLDKILIPLS